MSNQSTTDPFRVKQEWNGLNYYDLPALSQKGIGKLSKLPYSIRVLLESVLRSVDGQIVLAEQVENIAGWRPDQLPQGEVPFMPARVLMQDFTGVPAVVDLAAMRDAISTLGGDPKKINPLIPTDLVIDHSVQIDSFGLSSSLAENETLEFKRNGERYKFLRWGQDAFSNFQIIPPSTGIVHQINLEYLASVVQFRELNGQKLAYPDSVVGTDSHTTMVNGLGVLGWGVGGIEAEASMLGQPYYMLAPEVIGLKLEGSLPEGILATDLVLRITELLRKHGVVGKFVEFFGSGLEALSVPDRTTLANMAPEYGATVGFFPADKHTMQYLLDTGRSGQHVDNCEEYLKRQQLFFDASQPEPEYTDVIVYNLNKTTYSLAGPKRPQDRVELNQMKDAFSKSLSAPVAERGFNLSTDKLSAKGSVEGVELGHGSVVIAAITSCTNTSNPSAMIAAGLLAHNAVERGLNIPNYVKTSLAPGSRVVTDYLERANLMKPLRKLGFEIVGYGCTTCIGNSGPLPQAVGKSIQENNLVAASVLSGNRNFEGRINPLVKANYLASPPLVIAYALAGSVAIDLSTESLGKDSNGEPVYLKDIWPSSAEVDAVSRDSLTPEMFRRRYAAATTHNERWNSIALSGGELYEWDDNSTYIHNPPYFKGITADTTPIKPLKSMRVLALLGDSITTDHISPAGAIMPDQVAGKYLIQSGVPQAEFNTFGSRRGNDCVMVRGTFANIRIKNLLLDGVEGGFTRHMPSGDVLSIYEAANLYQETNTPLIVIGGKEYGTGSSRDWAAKGTMLLGVKAVLVESIERIHRSNLVGMGVLPLQFVDGASAQSLGITGEEEFSLPELDADVQPKSILEMTARKPDGQTFKFSVQLRIDSSVELNYYRNGGILNTILRQLSA